ncbi:MAG: CRTAC1 family protein [Anaerolineae bacterium]|nr:CRTAC1 family protein [Anaerolineae bacterium]
MKRHSTFAAVLLFGVAVILRPPDSGAQADLNDSACRTIGMPATTLDSTFTDVAAEVNATAPGYGAGAAWGDYDGDGDQDLYVVNLGPGGAGQANVLLRNDGAIFTDVSVEAGVGDIGPGVAAAWADMDNDSDLDLFVSNRPGNNALYVNDGAGHFQNIAVAAGVADPAGYGEGAAWADDDQDGLVDLYMANYSSAAPPYPPNRLYRSLDGSSFQDIATERQAADTGNGEGIAWADLDNDGDLDLYVANAGGTNVLFQRQDDGTFADVTAQMHVQGGPGNSFGAAWGDYDNDGWLDLYVAQQGTNRLYRNLSGADFADVTAEAGAGGGNNRWSLGCAWGDYDNDGDLDLHMANATIAGYDSADLLLSHEGGSPVTFADVTAVAGVTNTLDARGNAWVDYDNDGDLDLYVVNQGSTGEPNRLFRNNGTPNHWLEIRLIGAASNRSAIGARLTVSSDRSQIREISGGSGFASQDSLLAEFGLGDWGEPVDVTVLWPSGIQSSLSGVAVDQLITLIEPWRVYLPIVVYGGS